MKAWVAPAVPRLPGVGQVPLVHDHATGQRRVSARGERARMYVCGITPYDATHLGHTATYVAFDLLARAWRDAGLEVHYVQNVTDVDDPLLERADETGEDWRELAERQTDLFRADMAALRVLPPTEFVGVVESIPLVAETIERLRQRGAAYSLDGDLYFPVSADPRFGQVSHLNEAEMRELFAERGGDPTRPGKRDPLDSLLWRGERPGEPAWDTPLGRGRPGWHVECTAIALRYLGMGFDVQGGGSDLVFPHHEMSASLAQVLTGEEPFAHAYVYHGMVGLDGEKMSKSKGNLVFSAQLRADGVDPMAIRLAVLSHHYREDWEWSSQVLRDAQERLDRWRAAAARPTCADGRKVLDEVRAALASDLDTPAALACVDAWAEATLADAGPDRHDHAHSRDLVVDVCDALLGVQLRPDAA
ncbi:cysteine--1-D-myo-inosityl 2-amino-2-deoxy-alpha-D-glucopyranoside ligase [Thermasporomyces composti]|uniref:L-cysteine:1D-myo-inositol 2-amino-2-deoxy-alpha-D-glucopyranoside ligase n=1 Tax=Thermasporomyces composti TaxID=696763 RepID=A0A3D9VDY2_THECX|nr:cysteine--1-D-myo-inosityl 2-amino-2-deoxy-alpha-D-glucopyranoside ligase [Thermasporomyces composti]REF38340.1 L-cysteine:1D-myo-inositol 2-amino-2-deoxy-alpha-D-glucopyranoside ligase [Thermasporomyces composti]